MTRQEKRKDQTSRVAMGKGKLNERRRTLLKLFALGGGAFVLGKILSPGLNLFGGEGDVTDFRNFRVVERGEELGVYDKSGNEILIIENENDAGTQ